MKKGLLLFWLGFLIGVGAFGLLFATEKLTANQIGGGPTPKNYSDWQEAVVPVELQEAIQVEYRYRWYQGDGDKGTDLISCVVDIKYTNLSPEKEIESVSRVYLLKYKGEIFLEEKPDWVYLIGGIKPGETRRFFSDGGSHIESSPWGDWRWENLSVVVSITSLRYL